MMISERGCGMSDSSVKGKGLTNQQREFMLALQAVIMESSYPASVKQIRAKLEKSDSRVRSHIKMLVSAGFVCCVGRSKVKRYVPSMDWMNDPDADPEMIDKARCIGGYCETKGCNHKAADTHKGRFLCRSCIVGNTEIQDHEQLREEWLSRCDVGSSGGMLIDGTGSALDGVKTTRVSIRRTKTTESRISKPAKKKKVTRR
jgi:hypothetical protein